jgi:UDP-N-acetylglucosamine 2-epimerase (non-hydrolysing)
LRKRIFVIFGTRPEAIKMAPVILELKRLDHLFETIICSTSQHREMLDQILKVFGIMPDMDFNIMHEDQTLPLITSLAMEKLTGAYIKYRPDLILIQGDTTTAMIAALAGFYEKIPVAHIEAGLRTYNRYYPFPEEINRRIITILSTYHFAPTKSAAGALISEKVPEENIFITGNPVVDSLLYILSQDIEKEKDFPYGDRRILLITAHRRENFGTPMVNICNAILELVNKYKDIQVVFPVHLNPNVRNTVYKILGDIERIDLLDPLDYRSFVQWMRRCYLILTDSGGIQEEAAALGKPVLVLRNETERSEGVLMGISRITGTDQECIVREAEALLVDRNKYRTMASKRYLYGDGKAAKRITDAILKIFKRG